MLYLYHLTGSEAGLQVSETLLFKPSAVGPLSFQSLLQHVVHLPPGSRTTLQVQKPCHAASIQRLAEDEGI